MPIDSTSHMEEVVKMLKLHYWVLKLIKKNISVNLCDISVYRQSYTYVHNAHEVNFLNFTSQIEAYTKMYWLTKNEYINFVLIRLLNLVTSNSHYEYIILYLYFILGKTHPNNFVKNMSSLHFNG